jgi:hypothetical protein
MDDTRDLKLAELEDDLSVLEQHAKHVISFLGGRHAEIGTRVTALKESSELFEKIRHIKDKVHALRCEP